MRALRIYKPTGGVVTDFQKQWLYIHPQYQPVMLADDRVTHSFAQCGTLTTSGQFIPHTPRSPMQWTNGSFGVGIPNARLMG
jgi:hypothetical protein